MKSYNLLDEENEDLEDSFCEGSEEPEEEEVNPEFVQDEDTWQVFGELKVDDSFAIGNIGGTRNIYENFEHDKLIKNLYELFEDSPYKEKYENKKPVKSDILEIVTYFLDRIEEPDAYTLCEKVVAIADILKIDYLMMFNELPTKLRYSIIKELDEQFNIIENRSKKLF